MPANNAKGPLSGYKLIEIAGVGPTQLTGMLLADMGAEIVRVERLTKVELGVYMPVKYKLMNRSRRSIAIDLKQPQGRDVVLDLCAGAARRPTSSTALLQAVQAAELDLLTELAT